MRRFFTEPIRYIKESITIESEFEKPYADDNYNWMHLKWNIPDWQWEWGDWRGGHNPEGNCWSIENPFCQTWCRLLDDTHTVCQLVGGYSNRASAASGYCFGSYTGCYSIKDYREWTLPLRVPGKFAAPTVVIQHASRTTCEEDFKVGAHFKWREPTCSSFYRKECFGETRIFCADCVNVDPMVWEDIDGKLGEIARESSVLVEIDGGWPIYSWSITGTGFWLDAGYTTKTLATQGAGVTVYTDEYACGVGKINVSDDCGDTLDDGAVICTEGTIITGDDISGVEGVFNFTCEATASGQSWVISGFGITWYSWSGNILIWERAYMSQGTSNRCTDIDCDDGFCNWTGKCISDSLSKGMVKMAPNYSYEDVCCIHYNQTAYNRAKCVGVNVTGWEKYECTP